MFPCNHCGSQTEGVVIGHALSKVCINCARVAGHAIPAREKSPGTAAEDRKKAKVAKRSVNG